MTLLVLDNSMNWRYYYLTILLLVSAITWQFYDLTILILDDSITWRLILLLLDDSITWLCYSLLCDVVRISEVSHINFLWQCIWSPLVSSWLFQLKMVQEIVTDNAVYEDKLQVRSARLLEQFCILKRLHHTWCILLEASKETYMFREIHILKTKNPSNIFKYFYEPAVMAEQDGLTGSAWGRTGPTTTLPLPLRAFENELGVQAPVGFWDPAGALQWWQRWETSSARRATEIKHGRISMLATMGYITPELTGKFPGFLSPSAGLKFADCSQWTCSNLQSASSRLGSDRGIHGLLRSFPRPSLLEPQPLLETLDGSSSHRMTQRWRKPSLMQSWQTAVWPWWPSSGCFSRQDVPTGWKWWLV